MVYYTESSQLNDFIHRLAKSYRIFYPAPKTNGAKEIDYSYVQCNAKEGFVFNPYRAVEPLKVFFTYTQEEVSEYFTPEPQQGPGKAIIFGVKNCDIVGHRIQDFVFLEGVDVDSGYRLKRENTILITSDCTEFKEVCHCLAWDIMPYPTKGFDLNLSPLTEGYLVEVGSPKAEALILEHKDCFAVAKEIQVSARKAKRESLVERLKKHLAPQHLVPKDSVQKLMKDGYQLDTWKQFMLTCVECGGCNFICDTCHCFLLGETKLGQINKKIRVWDSCLYANYARVAGGANPLKTRAARLRFRFTKKFDFFVDNLGVPACCGCGRCIEVCPGKIDIREVLKDLAKKLFATNDK